jgi:hypothetical protein
LRRGECWVFFFAFWNVLIVTHRSEKRLWLQVTDRDDSSCSQMSCTRFSCRSWNLTKWTLKEHIPLRPSPSVSLVTPSPVVPADSASASPQESGWSGWATYVIMGTLTTSYPTTSTPPRPQTHPITTSPCNGTLWPPRTRPFLLLCKTPCNGPSVWAQKQISCRDAQDQQGAHDTSPKHSFCHGQLRGRHLYFQ